MQIASDGSFKHVSYSLDHALPRSADVSEHSALILAAMFATVPIQVVSDCQAVVSLTQKRTEQRLSYKVKMTGFAAQTNFNMVKCITKIKSHCNKELPKSYAKTYITGVTSWRTAWLFGKDQPTKKDETEAYAPK